MRIAMWTLGIMSAIALTLVSCFQFSYKETAQPTVFVGESSLRKMELELRKTVEISGNMHGPSNPFARPRVHESSDWLYFDKTGGTIDAADIVFTHWRSCPDPLWWQRNIRGSIELRESEVIISLQMPRYDHRDPSHAPAFVPWEHNGTYKLDRNQQPPTPVNPANCGK
jgi:hypothetical protein